MPKSLRITIVILVVLFVVACLLLDAVANQKDVYDLVIPDRQPDILTNNEEDMIHVVNLKVENVLDSELYWLARGMQEEAGINWSDEDILKIGTVIANRKDSPYYPDTFKGVLLDEGQYQPFMGKYELTKPDDHYIYLAMRIMEGYRSFDGDVIFQALFVQGTEVVDKVYDYTLETTTYFCR